MKKQIILIALCLFFLVPSVLTQNQPELKPFRLEGKVSGMTAGKITGSKTQDEWAGLTKLKAPVANEREMVWKKYSALRDSLTKKIIDLQYVWSHPLSYICPDVLFMFDKNEVISLDSLKSIYNHLDKKVQNSGAGIEIRNDIVKKTKSYPGAQAPVFKAVDLNGQPVSISRFKGKNVVVMDFWASWCGPCRETTRHLRELYRKYHSMGLEVIAVSTENDIYSNYFVQAIPLQILIDKTGRIVGRWTGSGNENEMNLDKKRSEIFTRILK